MSISLDHFIFFIETIPFPIIGIENGFIKSINSEAEELLGRRKHEAIGQNFLKIITTTPYYELIKNKIKLTFEQGKNKGFSFLSVEASLLKKNSLPFDAIITFISFSLNQNESIYACIQKKIPSHYQVERYPNISQKEERYFQLVQSIQDYAIFMLDNAGIIVTWNIGAEKIKGYKNDEIIGRHFSVLYLKKDIDSGKPLYALKTAAKDGKFEEENWRIRKDGSIFWASILITPLIDSEGKLQGFVKITKDLTAKKQSEEALKQVHEYYQLLLKSFENYAYFILDENDRIESWNEESKNLFGYSKEEIISNSILTLMDENKKCLENENFRNFDDNKTFKKECWFKRKNDSNFHGKLIIHEIKRVFDQPQTLLVIIHKD